MEEYGEATLDVENVGGIESTSVALEPGVTVLAGRNATNRTSLLRSLMAALGSDDASLKADADAGRVELAVAGEQYTRTFKRREGGVVTGGDPMLEDPEAADLFAFLLSTNEARNAAVRGEDLRAVLLRPVDVDELEAEIEELVAERDEIDARLAELEGVESELADLREERSAVAEELADVEARQEAVESAIAEADADPGDAALESTLEELREARAAVADVRSDLETQREAIAALEAEREELREERDALPDPDDGDPAAELERLRERRGSLEERIEELGTVVEFNERLLESAPAAVAGGSGDAAGGSGEAPITERLLGDDLECWTCGSEVERDDVEATLERLRDLRADSLEELREVETRLETLQEERREREQARAQRRQVERRLDRTDEELEARREQVGRLEADREAARERVEELEARVDEHRRDEHDEFLERHEAANELAVERDRLEARLGDLEGRIGDLEAQREERAELREQRESVAEALADRRTRVDRLEREAVEAFNDEMAALVDVLEYGNLERVWLERLPEADELELHVVRATDDGTAYEDTVSNLSESERELVGLVFALAGYLAHGVDESVPFVLLDSLEAIDADRIAALVEHFESYAPYLVVALLEEDAAALDDDYRRIRDV